MTRKVCRPCLAAAHGGGGVADGARPAAMSEPEASRRAHCARRIPAGSGPGRATAQSLRLACRWLIGEISTLA